MHISAEPLPEPDKERLTMFKIFGLQRDICNHVSSSNVYIVE